MRSKSQWVNWPRKPKKTHHNYVCYNYLGEPSHLATQPCSAGYRHGPNVERQVIERLAEYAFDPALIDQAVTEAVAATEESAIRDRERTEHLARELAAVRRRLDRWFVAFEDGTLDHDEFRERVSALHRQREELAAELARLESVSDRQAEARTRASDLRRHLTDLAGTLPHITQDELWAVLHSLIEEIWVDPAGLVVDVKFV